MFKKRGLMAIAGAVALSLGSTARRWRRIGPNVQSRWSFRTKRVALPKRWGKCFRKLWPRIGNQGHCENKAGCGSAVGTLYAKNQKPDGYTILFVPLAQFLWNPMHRPELDFHHSDFRPIAGIRNTKWASFHAGQAIQNA